MYLKHDPYSVACVQASVPNFTHFSLSSSLCVIPSSSARNRRSTRPCAAEPLSAPLTQSLKVIARIRYRSLPSLLPSLSLSLLFAAYRNYSLKVNVVPGQSVVRKHVRSSLCSSPLDPVWTTRWSKHCEVPFGYATGTIGASIPFRVHAVLIVDACLTDNDGQSVLRRPQRVVAAAWRTLTTSYIPLQYKSKRFHP